jgi:hypothetical protein
MTRIYESPDGGKTIYSRLPGCLDRTLVRESAAKQSMDTWDRWRYILIEAETNPTLKELIDKAEMVYALIKKEN